MREWGDEIDTILLVLFMDDGFPTVLGMSTSRKRNALGHGPPNDVRRLGAKGLPQPGWEQKGFLNLQSMREK